MKIDINILATSDVHGHYTSWDYSLDKACKYGCLSRIATIVKKQRSIYENTILVDTGDMFQGNCSEIFAKDGIHPAIVAMNELNYDIWEMGNHEYGYGLSNLFRFISKFKGEVLAANVYKDNSRLHKAYVIIEKQGIKIAFVGLITSLINKFEKGSDDMSVIRAVDMKKELEKIKTELISKADCVIGLIHAGLNNENGHKNTGIYDLISCDDYFTAVFCGHFHELIDMNIGTTTVMQPGKFGQALSSVLLSFEKDGQTVKLTSKRSKLISVDENVQEDEKMKDILQVFHKKALNYSNDIIGINNNDNMKYTEYIKGIADFRTKSTALTEFMLEVIRYYGKADVSMLQLDNDFAGIDKGIIRRKDINKNYSYVSGGITSFEISGKTLRMMLEYAAYFYNASRKGDINISFNEDRLKDKYSSNYFFGNIKYDIDLRDKHKIKNLRYINGDAVSDDDKIILACTKYSMDILKSGILKNCNIDKIYATKDELGEQGSIRNLIIKYIIEVLNKEVDITCRGNWRIIKYEVDDNIKNIVIKFLNKGYIQVVKSSDKRYKNTASINIYDKVDENDEVFKNLGIDISKFSNKGDLYRYAYKTLEI